MSTEATVLLQTAVGIVFALAGIAKVLTKTSIAAFLNAAGVEERIARLSSRVLPATELAIGSCLMLGVMPPSFAGLAVVLSTTFSAVLVVAYRRKVRTGCGCFGALDVDQLSIIPVVRSLALLLASSVLFAAVQGKSSLVSVAVNLARFPAAIETGLVIGLAFVAAFALLGQIAWFEEQRLLVLAASRSIEPHLSIQSPKVERG
jgi:uncharacterized membrane protein YphA (DoxX/SURF4 family)